MRRSILVLLLVAGALPLAAQEKKSVEDLTLEELLATEIQVASRKEQSLREAPGIVTVITEEEIRNSGARDLIDLLRLVPGFDFGVDVQGVVGAAMRGNWGHEGKILLLLDGEEMNEALYSTLQFGNRFPLSQLDHIEIVRGPGSAIYGGNAELGVINLITKSAAKLGGLNVSLLHGFNGGLGMHSRADVGYGAVSGAMSYSGIASISDGRRSTRDFTDFNGDTYNMRYNSDLDERLVDVRFALSNFKTRFTAEHYRSTERDQFGENLPRPTSLDFNSWYAEAALVHALSDHLVLTPRFSFRHQTPWKEHDEFFFYDKSVDRAQGDVTLEYEPSGALNVLSGVSYFQDHAKADAQTAADLFPNGKESINYQNLAVFSQAIFSTSVGKFTAGARYEHHSAFGSSFVPRLAMTRVLGRMHFKALASRAFRAPGIENIRLSANNDIRPEKTTAYELEAGYQLNEQMIITGNVFDTKIHNPIVYFVNSDTDQEGYVNFPRTGTRGLELEYRVRSSWGYLTTSYSYYRANDNRVPDYNTSAGNYLLGFSPRKLAMAASFKVGDVRVNPSVVWLGQRYGYTSAGESDAGTPHRIGSTPLANLYFSHHIAGTKLRVGAGVFNLLDRKYAYIQPYNSFHAPLPSEDREIVVRVTWSP